MVRASGKGASRHIQLGKDPRAGSDPGGEIISLHWPGNASGSPSQGWLMWPGKGNLGLPVESAASAIQPQVSS